MNEKRATIKDLQRETGLALGTISKYLNGGSLKKNNKKILEEAIKKLDFHVNPIARGMVTGKTMTIGLAIPELGNAFYGLIASYFDEYLRKYNYDIVVKEFNNDPIMECKCVDWFIERRMDAIICFSLGQVNKEFYERLNYKNLVFIDNKIDGLKYDFIGIKNYETSKQAVSYLIEKGHKNIIGMFVKNSYTSNERYKGYCDALTEHGISINKDNIIITEATLENTCSEAVKVIKEKKATAIFSSNYITTLGVMFASNELNLSIPNDISILGFDNIMLTNIFTPKVSIIEQPLKKIAELTANRIVELENNVTGNIELYLDCEFQEGNSIKTL